VKVVLHIGAHKTGTSLIQKYFRDRACDFEPGRVRTVSRTDTNRLIGWGGGLQKHPHLLRRRLQADLRRRPDTLLVSHENALGPPFVEGRAGLYPDADELAGALADVVCGIDTRVVFYIRPVPEFVESYYLQTLHQGSALSFEDWFRRFDAPSLEWTPVVDALERHFGVEAVVIGDFEEIRRGQDEFLRRFIERAGIPSPTRVSYAALRNPSVSRTGMEVALAVNPYLENRAQRRAMRDFLQTHFSNATGERARPMPDDLRIELGDRTADEYRRLVARTPASLQGAT
jgi:hypothetical protein